MTTIGRSKRRCKPHHIKSTTKKEYNYQGLEPIKSNPTSSEEPGEEGTIHQTQLYKSTQEHHRSQPDF